VTVNVEGALLESRTMRDSMVGRTEVLDRVKVLTLLPDGMHVTTAMVAAYFEVGERVINRLMQRHRDELTENGMRTLRGADLERFKRDILSLYPEGYPQPRAGLTLYPRRVVLNVAMLLRDSEVARQVRTYLLDVEHASRAHEIVDDRRFEADVEWLDARIERISERTVTRILGKTVVPMLNALIESAGEHRRDLAELRQDIERVERRLTQHDVVLRRHELALQQRPLAGVMASIDAMNWREFEQHVAQLCRRDGCTDVVIHGGNGDRGADITGFTADGRRLVVQCKNYAPHRSVWSGEMQKFLGAAKVQHEAEVALFVATCPFTREALDIAAQHGITAVHRGLLEAWSAGAKLQVLR
jgi:restriction system protein